jgi:Brp/Blh family beta-carotene 15,15'-monooxygenase
MLFLIGIPHGALDGYGHANGMRLPKFIFRYSAIMAVVLLLWVVSPIIGLITFILYSAWHFGETDMREWGLPNAILSITWGMILFVLLLFPHMSEVNLVLHAMGVPEVIVSENILSTVYAIALSLGIFGGLWFASVPWLISTATLLLLGQQSLALAFGTYFILQHSASGWDHLKKAHQWSNVQMFIRALPFTAGAVGLFLLIFNVNHQSISEWSSYLLIFLSALSLPHIYFMSRLYQKQD